MDSAKPAYRTGRISTVCYAAIAFGVITGVVQLVTGNTVGWLLILFAPVVVFLGFARVSQLRDASEKRTNSK